MVEENAIVTYTIQEQFERALPLVRKTLAEAKLDILDEWNVSDKIQRALSLRIGPCVMLFIGRPAVEDFAPKDFRESALRPLHVVVEGRGARCQVHLLRALNSGSEGKSAAYGCLQATVARSVATIGMREAFTVVSANMSEVVLDGKTGGGVTLNHHCDDCILQGPLDRSLKTLRTELAELDLDIVGEFAWQSRAVGEGMSKTLLVNCPLLFFEAVALDHSSAVLFPLHVVARASGDVTRVSIANPIAWLPGRLPVGAAEPLRMLVARVHLAFTAVSERAAVNR